MNRQAATSKGLRKRIHDLEFTKVEDPRAVGQVTHPLPVVLTALVAAMVIGLEKNTADVLWRILRCAERLPAPELVPHLASHVSSNLIQVRVHAYRALARQNNQAALNAVLLGVQNEKTISQQQHQRTEHCGPGGGN